MWNTSKKRVGSDGPVASNRNLHRTNPDPADEVWSPRRRRSAPCWRFAGGQETQAQIGGEGEVLPGLFEFGAMTSRDAVDIDVCAGISDHPSEVGDDSCLIEQPSDQEHPGNLPGRRCDRCKRSGVRGFRQVGLIAPTPIPAGLEAGQISPTRQSFSGQYRFHESCQSRSLCYPY
jgi:hypothetical protein